jgi:hypothetical protein
MDKMQFHPRGAAIETCDIGPLRPGHWCFRHLFSHLISTRILFTHFEGKQADPKFRIVHLRKMEQEAQRNIVIIGGGIIGIVYSPDPLEY